MHARAYRLDSVSRISLGGVAAAAAVTTKACGIAEVTMSSTRQNTANL